LQARDLRLHWRLGIQLEPRAAQEYGKKDWSESGKHCAHSKRVYHAAEIFSTRKFGSVIQWKIAFTVTSSSHFARPGDAFGACAGIGAPRGNIRPSQRKETPRLELEAELSEFTA
jgi:hypothetical protein